MAAYSPEFWRTSLPLCDLWRTLTPSQRAEALNIPPTYKAGGVIPLGLPDSAREAFLERDEAGRYRARKEFASFQKMLLRALDWSQDTGFDVARYLQQMTTTAQRVALTGSTRDSALDASLEMENRLRQGRFGKALGASPSAETWTRPAAGRAIAVVGGNFTVTMLEASLELEAELAAFAVPELLASAPKDFERLSPTVLANTGKAKPAALIQRLGKKGYLFH